MPFPAISPMYMSDDSTPQVDDQVSQIVKDSSENVYIIGDFASVTTVLTGCVAVVDDSGNFVSGIMPRIRNVASLYASPPNQFNTPTVTQVISDGSGGYYVAGSLRSIIGMPSTWDNMQKLVVHILSDGTVDPNFQVAMQTDYQDQTAGTHALYLDTVNDVLYVGGRFPMGPRNFASSNDVQFFGLVAVDPTTGELLTAWNPNVTDENGNNDGIAILCFANDGNYLYVGGSFKFIDSQPRPNLARFDITSFPPTLYSGFSTDVGLVYCMVVESGSGSLYVGGGGAAKFASNGLIDSFWNPNPDDQVYNIALDGAGSAYIVGEFDTIGGQARRGVARVTTTSGAADSWDPVSTNLWDGPFIYGLLVDGNDIYLGGLIFESFVPTPGIQPTNPFGTVRVSASTGAVDVSWYPASPYFLPTFGFLKTGSNIMFWGDFGGIKCLVRTGAIKIDASGNLVTAFNPDVEMPSIDQGSQGAAILTITMGTVLACGEVGGVRFHSLATGETVGSMDVVGTVYAVIQKEGTSNFYIGGTFTSVGTSLTTRNKVAEINGTTLEGETWPNLGAAGGANGQVSTLHYGIFGGEAAVGMGGTFTSLQSTARNRVGAINILGDLTSYNPNSSGAVVDIVTYQGGIVISGGFITIGGLTAGGAALTNALTGALVTDYNVGSNFDGDARVHVANGRLYILHDFDTIGPGRIFSRPLIAEYSDISSTPTLWNANGFGFVPPGYGFYTTAVSQALSMQDTTNYFYIASWVLMGFGGGSASHFCRIIYPERVNLLGPDLITGKSQPITSTDLGTTNTGAPLFGITGARGITGIQGPTGISLRGPYGERIRGITGFQGFTGLVGISGPTGLTATPTSRTGPTGLAGITGATLQGVTGITGATGVGATTSNTIVNSTPFTVNPAHFILLVDTSGSPVVIDLPTPSAARTGKQYGIYDFSGNAATNNITITCAAGSINGQPTFVIVSNYGSVDIYSNGQNYFARTFNPGGFGTIGLMGLTGLVGV